MKITTSHTLSLKQKIVHYFHCHLEALKTSAHQLLLHPILTLFTLLTIGLSLSLPLGFYSFFKPIQQISQGWDQGSEMTLYLRAASPAQIDTLLKKTKQYPVVEKATYLSPEQVLKEFQQTAKMDDVFSLLPENPLPGLIQLRLAQDKIVKSEMESMQAEFAKEPLVDKIVLDYEWIEKLNAFLALGKTLTEILSLIIGLGVIFIVGNTLRLALERHRDEIEVFAEVGATKAYIRRPFLYRGTLYGLFGGLIAVSVLDLITYSLKAPTHKIASLYQSLFSLEYLSFSDTLAVISICTLLGWLGALFAFSLMQYRLFRTFKEAN